MPGSRVRPAGVALPALVTSLGCDPRTQHRVLSAVVDGVPPYEEWMHPKPRPRPPRLGAREAPRENPPPPKVAVRAELPMGTAGFPSTWEELSQALPQDALGDIDWTRALTEGLIDPRNTIPPEPREEQTVLPLDLELGKPDDPMRAIFPHEAHTRWLACDNCHTELFPMQAGGTAIDMGKIMACQSCGVCHGTVAFPATSCARCHPGLAG